MLSCSIVSARPEIAGSAWPWSTSGTAANGKGSTVAMLAALARSANQRVATYTSPHLSTLRERITVDGELATETAIVEAAARVSAAGGDELTFFEQITAIAMVIIADARVDVTVLEVGLGGRLDATNVVSGYPHSHSEGAARSGQARTVALGTQRTRRARWSPASRSITRRSLGDHARGDRAREGPASWKRGQHAE